MFCLHLLTHFTFTSLAQLPFLFPPPTSFLPPSRSPPSDTHSNLSPSTAAAAPIGDAGGKKKKHKADQAGAAGAMVLAEPKTPVAPGNAVTAAAAEASPAPSSGKDAGGKKKKRKVKEGDVSAAHTATATPPSAVKVAGGKKAKKAAAGSS
ncbi:unnamed protein product [Closterium sp. NIES-65]|nr:unnamed protein product [Closterium sp. NIES-65]